MTELSILDRIETLARSEGFDLVGLTSLDAPADADRFEQWLDEGLHGQMDYLEKYRPRIVNPRLAAPGAKSVVCVGVNHSRAPGGFRGGGRVARYALGRDYHHVLDRMLRALGRRIEADGI